LRHSFPGAPASERKRAELLQLFASGFLHSRESNVAQKKPSASTISNFLRSKFPKHGSEGAWEISRVVQTTGARIMKGTAAPEGATESDITLIKFHAAAPQ